MAKKEKKVKEPKEKKPTDKELGAQIVKSATAVVCSLAVGLSFSTAVGKIGEAKIEAAKALAEAAPAVSENSGTQDYGTTDTAPVADSNTAEETPSDTEAADEGSTEASDEGTTEAARPEAAQKEDNDGSPKTNAEIIAYCNKALNDAKAAKVGYTKTFVRGGGDNLPKIVSSIIAQNKVTTAAKGSDGIVDDFPAGGFAWSCKLRESDVSKVECKKNGQYYEITLRLPTESNPAKGEASKYGRAMTVIDAADAKEMLSAVKSVNFTYHDGYVYAKIDAKTGKLVKAEFSATADLEGELAVIGAISAKGIKSTETFTDIKW